MTPNTNKPHEKGAITAEEIFNESIEGDGSRKTIISAMQEYAQQFTNFDVIKVDEMRTFNDSLQSQLHTKSEECERLTRELNLSNKEKDHWYKLFVKVATRFK